MKTPKTVGLKNAEEHIGILLKSYENFFAESLVSNVDDPASALEELWSADFVVVSHGIGTDPIFNFGNKTALTLFELGFIEFTKLPSRKSAEQISQTDRNELLAEVTKNGCINNYTGVRVSSTGKRFFIKNAKVWNLYDENSDYYGQAAMFKSWERI